MKQPSLVRASLAAFCCAALLALLAFWPTPKWQTPVRPRLKAPIVFDELQATSPPPSEASPAP